LFGIQRYYMTDAEGEGFIHVPMLMTEGETLQSQTINERRSRGLKYDEPEIISLTKAKITKEMQEFLLANMDGERLTDELVEYWLREELREEDPNWIQENDTQNSEEGEVGVPDLLEENESEVIFQEEEVYEGERMCVVEMDGDADQM